MAGQLSTTEARLRACEQDLARALEALRNFEAQLGALKQQAANGPTVTPFNQDAGYIALTPGGGIPAASGTTLGSASCTIYKVTAGVISADTFSRTVYNLSTSAVGSAKYIGASVLSGVLVAVLEPC